MKKRLSLSIVSCILAVALVVVGIMSGGFRNWNLREWVNKEASKVVAYDDEGKEMIEGKVYPLGKSMSFMGIETESSEVRTTGITVSVKPTPTYAINAKIDWSLAWNGPAIEPSNWTSSGDISNYVSVVPTSDGAYTAVVTFKANFGRKIILSASVRDKSSVVSSCEINCISDYKSVTVYPEILGRVEFYLSEDYRSVLNGSYTIPHRAGNASEYVYPWLEYSIAADVTGKQPLREWFIHPSLPSKAHSLLTVTYKSPCTIKPADDFTIKIKLKQEFFERIRNTKYGYIDSYLDVVDFYDHTGYSDWYVFGFGIVALMQWYGASDYYTEEGNMRGADVIGDMIRQAITITDIPIFEMEQRVWNDYYSSVETSSWYIDPKFSNSPDSLSWQNNYEFIFGN